MKNARFFCEKIMRNVRLIQDFRDTDHRPTRRTLADGLMRLEQELGAKPEAGRCQLHVPSQSGVTAPFAAIWYRADEGDDIVIAYPFSSGCWAPTAMGVKTYLSLGQLDGALLDDEANVLLGDGRSFHALEFDVLPHPKDFTDLEHAIVLLTVRFLEAEDIGFRSVPEAEYRGIDYGRLPELSVRNVKELARYIDSHIRSLPRLAGEPPLGPVSLGKVQSTLSRAGIRKVRGRKPKMAA
jgi:hypothetical protein